MTIQGKFNKVVFPDAFEGDNNFQRMTQYGYKMIDSVIKQTLNTTIVELANMGKNIPKELTKKTICFAPNIIRQIRAKQAKEKRPQLKQRIESLLGLSGEILLLI